MMLRKTFPATALLFLAMATAALLSSCGSKQEALKVNNVTVTEGTASKTFANVSADFPTADDTSTIADSLRAFISATLHSHYYETVYNSGGGEPLTTTNPKRPAFTGDIKDGNAMAAFYAKEYHKELTDMRKDIDEYNPDAVCNHTVHIKLTADTATFVTYQITDETFTGGAHGSVLLTAASFSREDGHLLGYPVDTTKVKQLQPLLVKGIMSYYKKAGAGMTEKQVMESLFIENNTIPLPATAPSFTPQGISFVYQQYEIACYAAGIHQFTISYKDIWPYLTSEAKEIAKPFK